MKAHDRMGMGLLGGGALSCYHPTLKPMGIDEERALSMRVRNWAWP